MLQLSWLVSFFSFLKLILINRRLIFQGVCNLFNIVFSFTYNMCDIVKDPVLYPEGHSYCFIDFYK